jgi:hypothetical protein
VACPGWQKYFQNGLRACSCGGSFSFWGRAIPISSQAAALLDEPVSPYDVSSQSIFSFQKKQIWFESRSAQSCGSVTAHCRLAKHSAAHSSVHETARHVHDHSKLRHKVGRDSGGQHGAPAIERTHARPDGGATLLNSQLVHPGLLAALHLSRNCLTEWRLQLRLQMLE